MAHPELAKFIPSHFAKSVESTVSAFGLLGAVHHDMNPGNMLFGPGMNRVVVIDFGESYFLEGDMDQDWWDVVQESGDINYTMLRLRNAL
jgi:Ser/Thr protein kinase RdoA (MazF antagonist)